MIDEKMLLEEFRNLNAYFTKKKLKSFEIIFLLQNYIAILQNPMIEKQLEESLEFEDTTKPDYYG